MKIFVDRNYFLYTHGIRLSALCGGLVVVAGGAGIDRTVRALRRFLRLSARIPDERILNLTGYAGGLGVAKSDSTLVQDARKLGRQMAEILLSP